MAFSLEGADGSKRVVRDAAFDQRSRTEPLVEPAPYALLDEQGRRYTGLFDGHNVHLNELGNVSASHVATWILGTKPVRIPGGLPLDPQFLFTFFDHGRTEQRLNALWEFSGEHDNAVTAITAAGFARSQFDVRDKNGRVHLRSAGVRFTGRDSAHAIVYADALAEQTLGEIHVGEHNPLRGFGIGFLLHQWEIHR